MNECIIDLQIYMENLVNALEDIGGWNQNNRFRCFVLHKKQYYDVISIQQQLISLKIERCFDIETRFFWDFCNKYAAT